MKPQLLICSLALASAGVAQAAYSPVAIQSGSYNADVIVEKEATPRLLLSTSASVDAGTNNYNATWFEVGFDLNNPNNGLPAAGSTFQALDDPNHSFKMAPSYSAPNGILIDTVVTSGTFTLVTPAVYSKLSFLGSGGNGGDGVNVRVNHQDGTFETGTFAVSDWFGKSTAVAWIAGGRITQAYHLNTETDGNSGDGRANPRIYYYDIALTNTASPVTNIVLSYANGSASSHNDIMAVSGATPSSGATFSPIAVTGYTYDFIVEAGAPHGGRVMSQTIIDSTNVWATSQSLDGTGNTGAAWYEKGYNVNNDASGSFNNPTRDLTGTGLPHPGGFITNAAADHVYQMAPDYTTNNAIYISTVVTNNTITLTTPAAYSGLSFLGAAGGGAVTVNLVVNHQGGTSETNILTIPDWFNGSAPAAFIANGRVAVESAQLQSVNSGNPRLLQSDIVLSDATHPVTSIYLENTNTTGGRFSILAISGSTGALPPVIVSQPVTVKAYAGSNITFTSTATANVPITYQWQKGTNGVFVNIANGGNASGATTTTLAINNVGFSDQADYRVVATDDAGSANSASAALQVFSTATDVTQGGDPISSFGISNWGDGAAANAIDNSLGTKLGGNINSANRATGMTISPGAGRTIVTGLRFYTANDSTDRDPTNYVFEGSVDGGANYTLISSNVLALPAGRNSGSTTFDPLSANVQELRFANANGYTTYRITFQGYKGGPNYGAVQLGEVELLGTVDSSKPFFNVQPTDYRAFNGQFAYFLASATFNPAPTLKWMKGTNGVYVALNDGGNISGSQSTTLNINPATYADVADYIAVATSTAGSVTSSVVRLQIFSPTPDVTQQGDPIVAFGDTTGTRYGANADAASLIENTFSEWISGGSGPNAGAGFPPFAGPVGVVLTPSVGKTILTGLRFYPGSDLPAKDPADFVLEGSNDGGTTYSLITSGPLSLPLARNASPQTVDPTTPMGGAAAQEVLFPNLRAYSSYRLTFNSVRVGGTVDGAAESLHLGDVEFLGVPATAQPAISVATFSGGNLKITGAGGTASGTFSVLTNASLAVPVANWGTNSTGTFDASGNFSITLPPSAANPRLFYLIKTP